ncbi:hypothetical protein EON66_00725 [archaeon]|nr:MAG: hypothetical protein EON66_00725 [archaeon]
MLHCEDAVEGRDLITRCGGVLMKKSRPAGDAPADGAPTGDVVTWHLDTKASTIRWAHELSHTELQQLAGAAASAAPVA